MGKTVKEKNGIEAVQGQNYGEILPETVKVRRA